MDNGKLLKSAFLCLAIMGARHKFALAEPIEELVAKPSPPRKTWHIQEELQHIKKSLNSHPQATEPDDISKIENELNQIEKALGHEPKGEMATGIQQEDKQKSLRQTDDSLNSLKLDELNRIEKTFGYDAWIDYCEKSPGCKRQESQTK